MQKNILIKKKTAKDTGGRMCGCKTDGNRGCQN